MNLPKDWSKKPDWLEKAKEPTEGGFSVFVLVASALGLVACAGLVVYSLLV